MKNLFKNSFFVTAIIILLGISIVKSAGPSNVAFASHNNNQVTICHATGSNTNPYSKITVDDDAVDGQGNSDHNRSGHQNGEDIIPPGFWDWNGRNWNSTGIAIWNNNCIVPSPTSTITPTPTEEVTPTPTEEVTPTPTEVVTPTPVVCGENEENQNGICVVIECDGGGECEVVIGDPTPTPTPTEEVTPTPTTTDTSIVQSSTGGDGRSDGLSDGKSSGQVLGANTLARTGAFDSLLSNGLLALGLTLTTLASAGRATKRK